MPKPSPFRYFKTSPEIIRLAVMLYIRFPLSLRNVEDLLHERGIEISHETVRYWWNRFGKFFATEIRRRRVERMRSSPQWQWHLNEVFVKINGETHYLWRAVDHEGEVLESFVRAGRIAGAESAGRDRYRGACARSAGFDRRSVWAAADRVCEPSGSRDVSRPRYRRVAPSRD